MKKINEVETIWEFEEILEELANRNPALFAPLSFQYQILLQRHKKFIRLMTIYAFIVGVLIGIEICKFI